MNKINFKDKARKLRSNGKTYLEIRNELGTDIPKSTLSFWCKDVNLPEEYKDKIRGLVIKNAEKGRRVAMIVNRIKREKYLTSLLDKNNHLAGMLKDKDVAKIALSILYLGEGGKRQRGSLVLGNSDPFIISLFLYLLRHCYNIDEKKLRCTVQCRADQNIIELEKFWSGITKVSYKQFYKTRIDPRTIGKESRKLDYKGVCRIDYFSAEVFTELMQIPKIVYKGPVV